MKKLTFLHALMLFCFSGFSQISSYVISPGGGLNSNGNIFLEWTLGDLFVQSVTSSSRLYTQGFQQPLIVENVTPVAEQPSTTLYTITVGPNPVKSVLNVYVGSVLNQAVFLTLVDLQGNVLLNKKAAVKSNSQQINMEGFVPNIYFLRISNASGKIIHTYKIIKSN